MKRNNEIIIRISEHPEREAIEYIKGYNFTKANTILKHLGLTALNEDTLKIFDKSSQDITEQDKKDIKSFKYHLDDAICTLYGVGNIYLIGELKLEELSKTITDLDYHN
ncbi:hypothetical protein [Rickettsia helvetica]|uniref:Uncharacterized protein n=1 Tax=Rickettsia helvetica TaxID=35789 RepID=A0ABP0T498_RICHE|nr:hypothetical protein [Rickettsia helvetica]MCZ6884495.1 hypothetical protein [Rickettsia endosymbiont of Ixodes ricinus]MCZ6896643.1 hypothetical protein [Rickettsia endosymbiont of Ixodes ricinus]